MEKIKPRLKDRLESFDFDYWMQLAKSDPEQFERQRSDTVHAMINSSPPAIQKRLRGLQWRIDMEIRRSKNSMDACLRINQMMMNSVYASGGLIESIENLVGATDHPQPAATNAVVIPFPRRSE